MTKRNARAVWITWETQRRNRTLSVEFDAKLFEILSKQGRFGRYLVSLFRTMAILATERPDYLFVQNPSIVLASIAVALRSVFRYTLIVDAHNSGVIPAEGKSKFLQFWANWIHKRANFTIITNTELSRHITSVGGQPLVIPDPLPRLRTTCSARPAVVHREPRPVECFFICTWASDEPFREVIAASTTLGERFKIIASGRYEKVARELSAIKIPNNFEMTGYVTDADFERLLDRCDIVIDLTTRENCLVCGAYEAVAAEKPMVLSDTACLRAYFSKGVVFTCNDSKSIAEAIARTSDTLDALRLDVQSLKSELISSWPNYMAIASDRIGL